MLFESEQCCSAVDKLPVQHIAACCIFRRRTPRLFPIDHAYACRLIVALRRVRSSTFARLL